MFTFSSFETRYTDDDKSKFESMRPKNYNSVNENVFVQNNSLFNINVIQQRRNKKKKFKLLKLSQLFSIETTFLDVIVGPTITKSKSSADLNPVNIIENKRTRRPNLKYAKTT